MSDQADLTGASIKKIKNQKYVMVDINQMFEGAPPTIYLLAETLMLPKDEVFESLLDNPLNAHVLQKLYADNGNAVQTPKDLNEIRRNLKCSGTIFTASDRFPTGTETPYMDWSVAAEKPLVFRLSDGFIKLKNIDREQRASQEKLKALKPNFDALEKQRKELERSVVAMNEVVIKPYDDLIAPLKSDLFLLEAAYTLVNLCVEAPKNKSKISQNDMNDMMDLRTRVEKLKNEAYKNLLLDPPDNLLGGFPRALLNWSESISQMLHDKSFLDNVRLLVNNINIAPPSFLPDLCYTLLSAYNTLALTPRVDEVEADINEMNDILASKKFDASNLVATKHGAFADEVKKTIPAPNATNAISIIASLIISTGTQTVGQIPGPNTLCVSMVKLGGMLIAPKAMSSVMKATVWAGKFYRNLVNITGIRQSERVDLFVALDEGNLAEVRKFDWSKRFMNSVGWSSAIAVANLAAFFLTANQDKGLMLKDVFNLAASGTGAALGVFQALGKWSSCCKLIAVGQIGKVLGVVGGLAMVAVGSISAYEDYKTGDTTGMFIHGAGAIGGAISVAGFIMAGGAAASATVFGLPLGLTLMAIGALIAIGFGLWDLFRNIYEAKTKHYFGIIIDKFSNSSAYRHIIWFRPAFQQVLDAVNSKRGIDFWEIDPSTAPILKDHRFSDEDIEKLTN